MPYVASDGRLVENPPFLKRVQLFFVGLWAFIVMFFKTLFGQNVTRGGDKYSREYRGGGGGSGPGSGPGGPRGPRPPERRVGRIARMSDICTPGGG